MPVHCTINFSIPAINDTYLYKTHYQIVTITDSYSFLYIKLWDRKNAIEKDSLTKTYENWKSKNFLNVNSVRIVKNQSRKTMAYFRD